MTKRLLTPGSSADESGVKPREAAPRDEPATGSGTLADVPGDRSRSTGDASDVGSEAAHAPDGRGYPDGVEGALAVAADDPEVPPTARRLLDAAVDTFAERGFHATTTRDIATRAGLSPAGLYVHYPSKAALLGHLSRTGHDAALRLVQHTLGLPGDSPRRLHALVAAFVTWHAEHHTVARVVQYELRSLDRADREHVAGIRRELERLVEAEIRRGLDAGTLDVPHPRQATRAILSLAVDVARWFDPRGSETPRRLGVIYADLALRMLGAEPAGTAQHATGPTDESTEHAADQSAAAVPTADTGTPTGRTRPTHPPEETL
ncbi:TetR/AcrR family transcriptional regulator [Thalassiella azotivora]